MGKFLNKYYTEYKDHDDEKFKFITYPGFDKNRYVISNYGKIINFNTNHVMKAELNKHGYYKISLRTSLTMKKDKTVLVHRLVCWEFCKHKEGCTIVNHKDGNKANNYYKNLEWVTYSENSKHAFITGLTSPVTSFPDELIEEICQFLMNGNNTYDIYMHYYPDSKNTDEHASFYNLILGIRNKTVRTRICGKYKFPKSCKSSMVDNLYSKNELKVMYKYINKGYTDNQILRILGFTDFHSSNNEAKKYREKLRRIRYKLAGKNIKDPNDKL